MTIDTTNPEESIARDRLKRLFRFLRELNLVRNPVKRQVGEQAWVMWFRELPDHKSIQLNTFDEMKESEDATDTNEPDSDYINQIESGYVLKVTRPHITSPPAPPRTLVDWLDHGWNDPFGQATVRATINSVDELGKTKTIAFGDDPDRVADFERWQARWEEWTRQERPARQAMHIFESLYDLWGRIEREGERLELVLGDGILTWRIPSGGIHHPILLKRVQLTFDPSGPTFTISETDHDVELYSALLRLATGLDNQVIAHIRTELEQGRYHPLGNNDTTGFLRRLVQRISAHGQFVESGAPREETDEPVMSRDPVLFLRNRTLGYASAIEAIIESLDNREVLPGPLVSVVGIEQRPNDDLIHQEPPAATLPGDEPEDVLFSKPWNQEQLQIAERLERFGAVTVQGPPGTGKTHTIANLIGHLLAKGQSVLVTAHTTKALRVLRDQVVEPLRPLCVSILDNDLESRKQLEDSVNHIVERLSQSDASQLEKEAAQLQNQRQRLLAQLRQLRQQLLDARSGEYREIVINGQSFLPSDAARKVAREQDEHAWIPGPVVAGAPLPLSIAEVVELYQSNDQVSLEDEQDLSVALPNPQQLLTPEKFDNLLQQRADAEQADRLYRADLWELEPTPNIGTRLDNIADLIAKVSQWYSEISPWLIAVTAAGLKGGAYCEPWDRLLEEIADTVSRAARFRETDILFSPQLCNDISLEEQQKYIEEILRSIGKNGKLGAFATLLHPGWRKMQQGARVSAGMPTTAEHFRALQETIQIRMAREQLIRRWNYLVGRAGGPSIAESENEPEIFGEQLVPALRFALDEAKQILLDLIDQLKSLGFRWELFLSEQPPDPTPDGEIRRMIQACIKQLPSIVAARKHAVNWVSTELTRNDLLQQLHTISDNLETCSVVTRLTAAVTNLDSSEYRLAYLRLVDLHARHQVLMRRKELLARLELAAPGWAAAIRSRRAPHDTGQLPGNVEAAWLWRQLHDELDRRAQVSIQTLQEVLDRTTASLQETTAELIERRSWAYQIRRTTLSQRQSLMGWLNIIRSIGKGYGKRAHRLRAEAAKAMNQARSAIPVWIMPLSRVVDYFDPRTSQFDVVIIDEASQADPLALAALYLGKRVIVVGDNEQVSPDAVGEQVEKVDALIREYLQGIPNAVLYDGKRSIYDIAWESFGGGIVLLEHFRCVPEIIQFSNALSYNGRIKPLRESSGVHPKPHVVPYRVDGFSVNKVNEKEALAVASLIAAAIEMPEYQGKTFGVISLVGEEQALEIEKHLRSRLSADSYMRHRILCGTPPQFQGDERDIVFLTLVDSANGNPPLALRQDDRFKRRFNVAASRAKDQMWVVYSLDVKTDLKEGDLRRRLIEHALNPQAVIRQLEKEERRVESEFERQVLKRLVNSGYRVRSQWPVGYYRIDLVVEGGGKRLAIECDGDRFHPIEKLAQDMARQAVLERLGWRFVRIRGSQFFRNPDKALKPVFEILEQMEIPKAGAGVELFDDTPEVTDVLDRVKNRAAEILQELQGKSNKLPEPYVPQKKSRQNKDEKLAVIKEPLITNEEGDKANQRQNTHHKIHQSVTKQAAETPINDPILWVTSTKGEMWLRMSRWAKEKGLFEGWERKILYSIGRYLNNGWPISMRQANRAQSLYKAALEQGFKVQDEVVDSK